MRVATTLNAQPFDLDLALAGAWLITREGKPAGRFGPYESVDGWGPASEYQAYVEGEKWGFTAAGTVLANGDLHTGDLCIVIPEPIKIG